MLYVLVSPEGRAAHWIESDEPVQWNYPEGYEVVEAPGFSPPLDADPNDYVYMDGFFALDEDGIADRELNRPYEPCEVLSALFQQTEVMNVLPDEALAHMAPYMAEWVEGYSYSAGDKVQCQERPYRCLQSHVSQAQWAPPDAPSLWARILGGQDGQISEWEQPDSTNPYMKGDKVTHNGHTWESDIDGNVWEPGVYGWTQIG